MATPTLTEIPKHHPDCCLSLSTTIVDSITSLIEGLPAPVLVLSIGSGSGLLENLVQQSFDRRNSSAVIEGVEVFSNSLTSINVYLPEESINTVNGTWDLSPRTAAATALMFVYPREPRLVAKYVKVASDQPHPVQMVLWLGPRVDWPDFKSAFATDGNDFDAPRVIEQAGLAEYEIMVVLKRRIKADVA